MKLARVQAGFRRQSDCASRCGAGGTRTHKAASTARLFSGQVPSAYRLAAPAESERFELPGRSSRPAPLPTVPLVPSGHSPCAEGERIERPQGSHPDLRLATGCLTSSASLPYAGRDLHPHAPFGTRASGARASAFRHQRLRVDDGSRTRDLHLSKVTRCQLRHIHVEPPTGIGPCDLTRTRGTLCH